MYHLPVFLDKVVQILAPKNKAILCDATLGAGGHSSALLLSSDSESQLIGIDRDREAIVLAQQRLKIFGDRVVLVQSNYRNLRSVLTQVGISRIDGLLVDAGCSSMQLDEPDRGFSFREDGPLDMRMDNSQGITAEEFLKRTDQETLTRILRDYGDVKGPGRIARVIHEAILSGMLRRTSQLSELVERYGLRTRSKSHLHPATLVFQAIRIAVNDELGALKECIEQLPLVLRKGGRAVFISFHRGEDRVVKTGLRDLAGRCSCPPRFPVCVCGAEKAVRIITTKPLVPTDAEVRSNPRARSARLRACEVLVER